MLSNVRMKGLFQIVWASALFAIFFGIGYWLNALGWHHVPWEFAIPAGFALAGLLQAITGTPFAHLASRWDSLQPWQRGVLGVGIVLASFALLAAAAVACISYQGAGWLAPTSRRKAQLPFNQSVELLRSSLPDWCFGSGVEWQSVSWEKPSDNSFKPTPAPAGGLTAR